MLTDYEKDRTKLEVKSYMFEFNDKENREKLAKKIANLFLETRGNESPPMVMPLVVCDETNNTPEVIDRHELHLDVYSKNPDDVNYNLTKFWVPGDRSYDVNIQEFHSYWRV